LIKLEIDVLLRIILLNIAFHINELQAFEIGPVFLAH